VNKDDFIYRLRPQPPPEFAVTLKAKLDRQATARRSRTWISWPLILGILIGGVTFAAAALLIPHLRLSDRGTRSPDRATFSARSMSAPLTAAPYSKDRPSTSSGGEQLPGAPHDNTGSTDVGGRRTTFATASSDEPITLGESGFDATDGLPRSSISDETGSLSAQELARRAVDTRQGLFRVLGWASARPVDMLRKRRPFDAEESLKYALRIEQLAPMIKDVYRFDTRSSGVESQSLDSVWDHRADFDAMVDGVRTAAANLAAAARTGELEPTMTAVVRLGQACAKCHYQYRLNGVYISDE
jgi:cytochrome c556